MNLTRPNANIFIPDDATVDAALSRTTHLAIGAHPDDLEFAAFHGIQQCFGRQDLWFTGVICTDGAGSARDGHYAQFTEEEFVTIRANEQRKAATIGEYSAVLQLKFPSAEVKDSNESGLVEDLRSILAATRPGILYVHNPADKHDTHVAVFHRTLAALRSLPAGHRPNAVYGCELWRGLDWMCDADKTLLPAGSHPHLQAALNGVFDSQIAGGKRYDLAVLGRRLSNATFHDAHVPDSEPGVTWAMDLTPLILDDDLSVEDFVLGHVDRLREDIAARLRKFA